MALDCANDIGFSNNQFVAVLHKDTDNQHIHIIANRIGYDGKTVSDSNNYQNIAKLCRKMELRYELKKVLSPNAFLPKELRNYQRMDDRKERLKADIKESLASPGNYKQFEQKMKALKYEVIKMRGIAFRDQKKVYTKGSEVGYSLATIQRILSQKPDLKIDHHQKVVQQKAYDEKRLNNSFPRENEKQFQKENQSILDVLLNPRPEFSEGINQSLLQEQRKRREKHKHRHL